MRGFSEGKSTEARCMGTNGERRSHCLGRSQTILEEGTDLGVW